MAATVGLKAFLLTEGVVEVAQERLRVGHDEDLARRIALLEAARAALTHLLELDSLPDRLVVVSMESFVFPDGALVEGVLLFGRLPTLPVRARHVDLLPNVVARLLQEGLRCAGDSGLLAFS